MAGEIVLLGKLLSFSEWTSMYLTSAAVTLAKEGDGLPDQFVWKTSDNRNINMIKKEVQAFHTAVTEWIYKQHKTFWKHAVNMQALTTVEEIEDYDIHKGWPGNLLEK